MSSMFPTGNEQTPRPPRTLRDVLEATRIAAPERATPQERPLSATSGLAVNPEPALEGRRIEDRPLGGRPPSLDPDVRAGIGARADVVTPPSLHLPIDTTTFFPKPPESIEEIGLVVPFIEDHIIRVLYFSQQATGSQIAAGCGVPYVAIQH